MKVLHVFVEPRGGGGSLDSTLATIKLTRQKGHDVQVFTKNSYDFPENLAGRCHSAISAFHAPESLRQFSRKLMDFKPDLIHANELRPYISTKVLQVCREHHIPVIMTCDDYHLTCPVINHYRNQNVCTKCLDGKEYWAVLHNCRNNVPESIISAMYNFIARKRQSITKYVDHFITCSEFTRQWLIKHANISEKSITAIPHAIDIPDNQHLYNVTQDIHNDYLHQQ